MLCSVGNVPDGNPLEHWPDASRPGMEASKGKSLDNSELAALG